MSLQNTDLNRLNITCSHDSHVTYQQPHTNMNIHVHKISGYIYIHDVIRDVERKKERKTPEAMEK